MWNVIKWIGIAVAVLVVAYLIFFFGFLGGPQGVAEQRQTLTAERFQVSVNIVRLGLELYLEQHGTYPSSLAELDNDPLVPEIKSADVSSLGQSATYRVYDGNRNYELCVTPAGAFAPDCFTAESPLPI